MTRFLIDPTQTDEEIVDFIMSVLEEDGAFQDTDVELPLREHLGGKHDQKSHAGKGGGQVTGQVSDPQSAAAAISSGGTANVTRDDLDDVLYALADSAPPKMNMMNLYVDGQRITGDMGLPYPRSEMPQFDGEVKARFIADLGGGGVTTRRESVDPAALRPGQNEIDAQKTSRMSKAIAEGTMAGQDPIIISSDNRVIDGNHRYAAISALRQDGHPDLRIEVIRVDMPASTLLPLAKDWTASHGIANRGLGT